MRQRLDATLQEYLDMLLAKSLPPMSENKQEEALADCIHRLKERWLRKLLISTAEAKDDNTELEERQQLEVRLGTQLWESFLQRKEGKNKGRGV
jgi:hypothetical protein